MEAPYLERRYYYWNEALVFINMVEAESIYQNSQNLAMGNSSIKLTVLGAGFNKRVFIILGRKVVKEPFNDRTLQYEAQLDVSSVAH